MTKISDEHPAARELYEAFVRVARERPAPTRARAFSRRRRLRLGVVVAAIVLGLAAAAGAAGILITDAGTVEHEQRLPGELRRAPKDAALAEARAVDSGGRLPWAERVYSSAAGGRCAVVGQLNDGVLGILRGPRFTRLPADASGACAAPGAGQLIAAQTAIPGSSEPIVIYGFVDRTVDELAVVDGGRRSLIDIAADGSFITIRAHRQGSIEIRSGDKTVQRPLLPQRP